jgi:tRNA(Ile)-lysidine synthase
MIDILHKIPTTVTVACSGGPDSMAVVDFLRNGRKNVRLAYFDHGTDHGAEACDFLTSYSRSNDIPLVVGKISRDRDESESPEEFWRNERYEFLNSLSEKIITAHHLDDAVEWWLFTSFNGTGRLIPSRVGKFIRPFLSTPKSEFISWNDRKSVPYIVDPSNKNLRYARCRIRHRIIPEVLKVNPGIGKVIRKKIELRAQEINSETRGCLPVC